MSIEELKYHLKEELGMDEPTIDYLWTIGIISEKETKRWLFQKEYYERIKVKDRDTCFSILIDVSVEFGVTHATARNYVYYQSHVA